MAEYTLKNIKDLDDMAPQFGMGEELEARFARDALELKNFGLSYQKLAPGFRVPFGHRHAEQEEVYVILSGSARLKVADEILDLKQWDAIRVPAEVVRDFEAGPEGTELLAIGAPQAKDTEMLQGWWS